MDDYQLLRAYVEKGSEAAFTELVRLRAGLVYSAASRQLNGDRHLAEDAAQKVFMALARKAATLGSEVIVSGWLYTTTRNICSNERKARAARQKREQAATVAEGRAAEARPDRLDERTILLDEGLAAMAADDRNVMLLRFFEDKTFAEVGATLGLTEDAARKRVERSLAKLRDFFARRGLVMPQATLATWLAENAVQAPPTSLIANLSHVTSPGMSAPAMVTGASTFISTWGKIMALTASSLILAGITVVAVIGETSSSAQPTATTAPAATQAEAPAGGPWIAELPDGETVEVVAIANHPMDEQGWWKPDGSPMSEQAPPAEALTQDDEITTWFINTKLQGQPRSSYRLCKVFTRSNPLLMSMNVLGFPDVRPVLAKSVQGHRALRENLVILPHDVEQVNLRVGVGSGQPETLFEVDGPKAVIEQTLKHVSSGMNVLYRPLPSEKGDFTIELIFPVALVEGDSWRVEILANGERISSHRNDTRSRFDRLITGDGMMKVTLGYPLQSDQVEKVAFKAIRYAQVADFRNVSLKPGVRTQVDVDGRVGPYWPLPESE